MKRIRCLCRARRARRARSRGVVCLSGAVVGVVGVDLSVGLVSLVVVVQRVSTGPTHVGVRHMGYPWSQVRARVLYKAE